MSGLFKQRFTAAHHHPTLLWKLPFSFPPLEIETGAKKIRFLFCIVRHDLKKNIKIESKQPKDLKSYQYSKLSIWIIQSQFFCISFYGLHYCVVVRDPADANGQVKHTSSSFGVDSFMAWLIESIFSFRTLNMKPNIAKLYAKKAERHRAQNRFITLHLTNWVCIASIYIFL